VNFVNHKEKTMNILTDLFRFFKMPTPMVIAAEELAEAKLELLKAETGVEFASAVAEYNRNRIARLNTYLIRESA